MFLCANASGTLARAVFVGVRTTSAHESRVLIRSAQKARIIFFDATLICKRKRVINMTIFQCKRTKEKYRGFKLEIGDMYGRDDKSPFVWQGEYEKGKPCGIHATLRLFRLDMESTRGWYEVWEQSLTTRLLVDEWANAAFASTCNDEPAMPYISHAKARLLKRQPVQRWGWSNRCSEVPVTHKQNCVLK